MHTSKPMYGIKNKEGKVKLKQKFELFGPYYSAYYYHHGGIIKQIMTYLSVDRDTL